MLPDHEQLPTGKRIIRTFDDGNQLISEMHLYGTSALDISMKMEFSDGVKTGETYIIKNRLVTRARYEKARQKYPDMPQADNSLEDFWGEAAKAVDRERRQRRKAAETHEPDPRAARMIDGGCRSIMEKGRREDGVSWIESSQNTLGELSHKESHRLVAKLVQLGCEHIYACIIDSYDDDLQNTGHLVVELPADADRRKGILREIDKLVAPQGYEGNQDDGQGYAYIKLD
jgi:hypothetical protein